MAKSETMWRTGIATFDQRLILDNEILGMIHRYLYCQKFNVSPYSSVYDDQPAFWVDFSLIMEAELNKYMSMDRTV